MLSYENRNRHALNYLKTVFFDVQPDDLPPAWTPCNVSLMPATWMKYREALEDLVLAHPRLFPGYEKGSPDFDALSSSDPLYREGQHTDAWGCVWENVDRGLSSLVVHHPLADWDALDSYEPPDPLREAAFGTRDWDAVRRGLDAARQRGDVLWGGGLQHGFMYMRLYYLRGFENFMLDLAQDDPRLPRLIQMVEDYNTTVIKTYLELGAEFMNFGDDLGLQTSLPMSPAMWRKYIKPSYMRMFAPCREADVPIYLHTDGHVLEIIPDLIEAGVRVLNPQFRANRLEGLQKWAKGRVAMNLDLDRQLFPFATPDQIKAHIHAAYDALHLPEGGLMLVAECEPDVPLENIETICTTLEEVCGVPAL